MSPQNARTLTPGEKIAIRGTPDLQKFSHIGQISKRTTKAVYATFLPPGEREVRFLYNNAEDMSQLRRADLAETQGYDRQAE